MISFMKNMYEKNGPANPLLEVVEEISYFPQSTIIE